MAVFTKLNQADISNVQNIFGFKKIKSFKGIKKGIENTNYLLKSEKKKYILTIFEKRVLQKEIPFFMKLMDYLNNSKINCPKPLKTRKNKYLIIITFHESQLKVFIDILLKICEIKILW